ncbi:hypothetical protein C0Z19_03600 [Trinickia soli]|uniref:Uncharacterized protein n=1 Tax=Trinickia soli TaxID=380675 RepID=A0A2N7WEE3_9BURK|nr:hypothetical protein C0Z19_03600 [Trinickia soli]
MFSEHASVFAQAVGGLTKSKQSATMPAAFGSLMMTISRFLNVFVSHARPVYRWHAILEDFWPR